MSIKFVSIILSVFIFFFVIELIRRERLTFKYAMAWIFISVFGIFCAIFEKYIFKLSAWLGFELPSNFIFFALLSVFVFLSLLMTIFLCQQDSRNDIMAQKIAILEFEIEQLKKKSRLKDNEET